MRNFLSATGGRLGTRRPAVEIGVSRWWLSTTWLPAASARVAGNKNASSAQTTTARTTNALITNPPSKQIRQTDTIQAPLPNEALAGFYVSQLKASE